MTVIVTRRTPHEEGVDQRSVAKPTRRDIARPWLPILPHLIALGIATTVCATKTEELIHRPKDVMERHHPVTG